MEGARYLEDGKLTVFRRAGIYYARIRISPRQYIWRSLKTSNEQTAVDLGRRLLFQIEQRADQGLPPKSKLFVAVIDDYIRSGAGSSPRRHVSRNAAADHSCFEVLAGILTFVAAHGSYSLLTGKTAPQR
jgi:hypothetical protein